jgi:hypothetical protein
LIFTGYLIAGIVDVLLPKDRSGLEMKLVGSVRVLKCKDLKALHSPLGRSMLVINPASTVTSLAREITGNRLRVFLSTNCDGSA